MHDAAGPAATSGGPERPNIDADRCVHAIVVNASCRACVEACPTSAWILSDGGLGLDWGKCDGCGVCVAACPMGAISQHRRAPFVSRDQPHLALVACEMAVPTGGTGVVPCLNALGFDELAGHYLRGVRHLQVCRSDCATCARGGHSAFDAAARVLKLLLEDRSLSPITIEDRTPENWAASRNALQAPSRRSLFAALRGQPAGSSNWSSAVQPGATKLPRNDAAEVLFRHVPSIDPETCEICDACVRICPTGALGFAPGRRGYAIEPDQCTNCRLCIDICHADAIHVRDNAHARASTLPIDEKQCRACGNVFGVWVSDLSSNALCRVCSRTRHSRNNYQVLK